MWKFIIIGVVAYILYRMFANDLKKKFSEHKSEKAAERERMVATGEMVKDPECGTYVAIDGAIKVRDGETVHHFCSYECRDKFIQRIEGKN